MDLAPCVRVSTCHAQELRKCLQSKGLLDLELSLAKDKDGKVLLPLSQSSLPLLDLQCLGLPDVCEMVWSQCPVRSKRARGRTGGRNLEKILLEFLESRGETVTEEVRKDFPRSFQRHGDLILLGSQCFSLPLWNNMEDQLWDAVTNGLGAKRLAKMGRISNNGFRSPEVKVLKGEHSWVTHVDNGIRYEFDVTKCMFASGNITEKLRVARLDCRGETVVDLYAGIGYFTLPYLVHAKATHVHACEWNPDAIEALHKNLKANGVSEHCTVHEGDNRQLQLCDVADRVNLGLIPSSEDGWPVACRLLKRKTGGVVHIHQNVGSPPQTDPSLRKSDRDVWQEWAVSTAEHFASLLKDITGVAWRTSLQHVERVKSYAPHVDHLVLDLECRPCGDSEPLRVLSRT